MAKTNAVGEYQRIMKDLKAKIYKPIYVLMGEETYYIDQITNYIATNILSDTEKAFNQLTLYGKDVDVPTIINAARKFPMMATHQVIIVKEAQNLKAIAELEMYVQSPQKSTILVIAAKHKPIDKRTKFLKKAAEIGEVFESGKLYDSDIPQWITTFLKTKEITISEKAAVLLKEYLGNDLSKIANELEKLMITLPAGSKSINDDNVVQNIGISKDYNTFELNKAISNREMHKAMMIADYFARNPKDNPLVLTIISLFNHFSKVLVYHMLKDKSKESVSAKLKINPFFVNDYKVAAQNYPATKTVQVINLLREYDMKSKGWGGNSTSDGELLKELLLKILF